MNQITGFVYIRDNELCVLKNIYKLGIASFAKNRDDSYITYEHKRGEFIFIIEIPLDKMKIIDKLLKNYFKPYNNYLGGGTEYYNRDILNLIEPYFQKLNIAYKVFTKEEIKLINRRERIRNILNRTKINIKNIIQKYKNKRFINETQTSQSVSLNVPPILEKISFKKPKNKIKKIQNTEILIPQPMTSYIPRNDQTIIIGKSISYFQKYNKGILVLTCGVGKTLISLWIAQKLNSHTILIGVPNTLLLKQWETEIVNLFHNIPYLIVSGGVNIENIILFLEKNQKKCIVITTYSSTHKVYTATENTNFAFNMKINDEVHHLTTSNMNENERKAYVNMLKIKSTKQMSLTATLKLLENKENIRDEDVVVSNDNVEYFGEIIDRKCLLSAIHENIICDYVIQTIITNEEQLEEQLSKFHITEETDKRLFLSAFASLKSIFDGHSHHLLVYLNNKENTVKLIQYIQMLLKDNYFDISDLYYSNYHSEMKSDNQKEILNHFNKSNFGIIACVYCLGEGYDNDKIDAVVFAENMTSNIRIVQSTLRASRKNKKQPNKITKIILPILNRDDWLENNNPDLKKVREVIYQMGLEDESIAQKIKVYNIDIKKQIPKTKPKINNEYFIDDFGEYDEELTRTLRLSTIKRTSLATTYEKAKKIIAGKNIKNKYSYYELCERDNRLSTEPDLVFKGQFTNWIEYLTIERKYHDLETCKNKVDKYILLYPEIKKHYMDLSLVCNELCKLDSSFPPNDLWVEYYNMKDLRDIITITNKKKRCGVIL
jgi:superfamily II DNA or RNA helicase